MTATKDDLTRMTPVEIDTKLSELTQILYRAWDTRLAAQRAVHYAAGDKETSQWRAPKSWGMPLAQAEEKAHEVVAQGGYDADNAKRVLDRLDAARLAETAAHEALLPWNAEYDRRGGWTRAYLVTDGHVHNTQECPTCHNGLERTRFSWMVDYSGKSEEEIVEDAGERACTVCYPSAPVAALTRPTKMFTPEEIDKQKAKADRVDAAVKRAQEKAAKAIANPDGTPLRVFNHHWPERQYLQRGVVKIKEAYDEYTSLETLHGARGWLTEFCHQAANGGHPSYRPDDGQRVAEAIAAKEDKTPETAMEEAKARAKRRK